MKELDEIVKKIKTKEKELFENVYINNNKKVSTFQDYCKYERREIKKYFKKIVGEYLK